MILLAIASLAASRPQYAVCIRKNLPALELSGERPDDVANATWEICKGAFEADAQKLANANPEKTARVMDYAQRQLVPAMATHVVRMRACRKTPSCAPAKLAWEPHL